MSCARLWIQLLPSYKMINTRNYIDEYLILGLDISQDSTETQLPQHTNLVHREGLRVGVE